MLNQRVRLADPKDSSIIAYMLVGNKSKTYWENQDLGMKISST